MKIWAEFLPEVEENSGSGDSYAKEMSDDFNKKAAELYAQQAKDVDIIITTARPRSPSTEVVTKAMVDSLTPGSVIVDLAAANGGNGEYTEKDKVITTANGVKIIGYTDMVSRLPTQSSQLYGTNLVNLMKLLCKEKDGKIDIDFEDVVVRGVTVIKDGEVTWPAPPIQVSAQPAAAPVQPEPKVETPVKPASKTKKLIGLVAGIGAFGWVASVAPPIFLSHFTVFVLACVVGYYVVWNVTHALHTPLMSVTNAISGIISWCFANVRRRIGILPCLYCCSQPLIFSAVSPPSACLKCSVKMRSQSCRTTAQAAYIVAL